MDFPSDKEINKLEVAEMVILMKVIRYIVLEALLLVAMLLCSTAVMKILDVILKLNYENVWDIGFKVGFFAWLILLIDGIRRLSKKKQ